MSDNIGKQYVDKVRSNLPPFGDDPYLPPAPPDRVIPSPYDSPAYPRPGFERVEPATFTQSYTVERYVRVNVTKNTKGWNTDCTVSVTTTADTGRIESELSDLLALAREVAEKEITSQKLEQYERERDI